MIVILYVLAYLVAVAVTASVIRALDLEDDHTLSVMLSVPLPLAWAYLIIYGTSLAIDAIGATLGDRLHRVRAHRQSRARARADDTGPASEFPRMATVRRRSRS